MAGSGSVIRVPFREDRAAPSLIGTITRRAGATRGARTVSRQVLLRCSNRGDPAGIPAIAHRAGSRVELVAEDVPHDRVARQADPGEVVVRQGLERLDLVTARLDAGIPLAFARGPCLDTAETVLKERERGGPLDVGGDGRHLETSHGVIRFLPDT